MRRNIVMIILLTVLLCSLTAFGSISDVIDNTMVDDTTTIVTTILTTEEPTTPEPTTPAPTTPEPTTPVPTTTAELTTPISTSAEPSTTVLKTTIKQTTKKATTATPTTKKATTKKATTASASTGKSTKYQVSISGYSTPCRKAKLTNVWKTSGNGVSVEIHRLTIGSAGIKVGFKSGGKLVSKYASELKEACYIAIISADASKLNVMSAQQAIGKNEALVQDMALKQNALIAINGESYYGHWSSAKSELYYSPAVRNGEAIYASGREPTHVVGIKKNGEWYRTDYTEDPVTNSTVRSHINSGLMATFACPAYIWNGTKVEAGYSNDSTMRNRTMLGQISKDKYVFLVGEFMSEKNMMDVGEAYGVKNLISFNGGNCTYLYLKGVGNVTGSKGKQIVTQNKLNMLEQEYAGNKRYIEGYGSACPSYDIIWF